MIVLTGASGGLGSYLVEHLSMDYEVTGTYHTHPPVRADARVAFYQLDVSNAGSIEQFVTAVAERLQRVVLINLAGISLNGMGHRLDESSWERVLNTNLTGTFMMCRALLPIMRKQEWGRIINISSVVAQMGIPGTVAYAASKGGLESLTRTLAAENAAKGITVNALALGYFEVGMFNSIEPKLQEQIKATIPIKRLGSPRDVELAVRFLIQSEYMTGAILNINGGLH